MESQSVSLQRFKIQMNTKDMVVTGLLTALVFIATRFINLRLPISVNGGLIHFGNVALFLSAIVFGKRKGAVAGAFGMGVFDVLSGWLVWAPFTFVIRGVMGYIIGAISNANGKNGNSTFYNGISVLAGSLWMITGYYLAEVMLYGNWLSPLTSVPGNIAQIILGLAVGLPMAAMLKRSKAISSRI